MAIIIETAYIARCRCGWQSEPLRVRDDAVIAEYRHQELSSDQPCCMGFKADPPEAETR